MYWPLVPAGSVSDGTAVMLAGLLPLAAIFYAALRSHRRERRIPNLLVLVGVAAGILLHTILPAGNGLLGVSPGGVGPWQSLLGLVIGAIAILPLYFLRRAGSGEVRLMAVVGAFLGPEDILPALFGTFLAGGLAALMCACDLADAWPALRGIARLWRPDIVQTGQAAGGSQAGHDAPHAAIVAVGTAVGVIWVISSGGPN